MAAHSICLEDGGALAYAERGMPGFDKMAEAVLSKSNGSPVRVWHDNFKGKEQWDFKQGRCLSFPDQECVTREFEKLPFFCEYYRVNPCDGGWHYRDGQCFKIVKGENGGFTFDEAREVCKALGSDVDLAGINSLAKNELVKHFVTKQLDCVPTPNEDYSWNRAWIGLQVVDHKLVWLNGKPADEELMKEDGFGLTYPWRHDTSLRSNDVQKCVHFDHLNSWRDFDCGRKNGFAVCGRKYPA
ncbi:lectin c-type domain-containing protein [Ditylenchus destructor]|uniref:Lectin c-type domain-containing protein n=1 Tax=Ditylenchus destructor TaxID=166010 RepID=A0AAD4MLF1_9BILA|nr:lectin c-type domain-containing protein [Ditylenchus destructor]